MIIARSQGFTNCVFEDDKQNTLARLNVPLRTKTSIKKKNVGGVPGIPEYVVHGIELITETDTFTVEYGSLSRNVKDRRESRFFRLLNGEALLSSGKALRDRPIEVTRGHHEYRLNDHSTWRRLRFEITANKKPSGEIYARGVSVGRKLFVDMDDSVPLETKCFMVFLICLHSS